jgi:F0F1-type ATP synthase assembly protein I
VSSAGKSAGMLGGAALAGWLSLIFLSFALAWLLDEVMPAPLAFFIVAVLYGIAAAVLAMNGRRRLTEVEPLPETRASLKEDVQWAREQKS